MGGSGRGRGGGGEVEGKEEGERSMITVWVSLTVGR